MLRIEISAMDEAFDESKNEFVEVPAVVLDLEHSLVSLSKWESKHKKPFLSVGPNSNEELYDYVWCMVVTPNVSPDVLARFTKDHLDLIQEYINSSESATTFGTMPERRGAGEVITSELIYYWLVAFNIPFECEQWHLNRLFALIRICNIKNSPPKKMSRNEIAQRNRELNAQRRAQLGTSG